MPSFQKWLTHVAAETPVDHVAHKAVASRLRAVAYYLEHARRGEDAAEMIHQLRIWTRRTGAALRLFAPALPGKKTQRLKRTLRKLRQAAGAVRDSDVQLTRLAADGAATPRQFGKHLRRQRRDARARFKRLRRKLHAGGRLDREVQAVLQGIGWPKRHSNRTAPGFGPWCRNQLAQVAKPFFELAERTAYSDAQLHELRKAGKRMRYALELGVAATNPRATRWLYDELDQLQDRLGAVCDRLIGVARIRQLLDEAGPKHQEELAAYLQRQQEQLEVARRQFARWWSAARRRRWHEKWRALLRSNGRD